MTPDAQERGYKAGRFSFNVSGGRCEHCFGDGIIKIEMHFLPDIFVPCEVCGGKRYNRETLEVKYKGKSISDVLEMTVEEACEFFRPVPSVFNKLNTLNEVGLGYIRLGQSATTLSGGEAQRVKLATELSKRSTGRTFYILDEPTTGLHTYDVDKLIKILLRLRAGGNTVLGHRAQPRCHQDRRLYHRPRPRRRQRRRDGRLHRNARGSGGGEGELYGAVPQKGVRKLNESGDALYDRPVRFYRAGKNFVTGAGVRPDFGFGIIFRKTGIIEV